MKLWHKISLALVVSSFPCGLFLLTSVNKKSSQLSEPVSNLKNVEAAILSRASEITGIDLRIATAQSEILRLQDNKKSIIQELQGVQTKLSSVIERATNSRTETARVRPTTKPTVNLPN
jgi:peptidoglycan hydrolase CwlO-like protein